MNLVRGFFSKASKTSSFLFSNTSILLPLGRSFTWPVSRIFFLILLTVDYEIGYRLKQLLICLLHTNELPLHHLVSYLKGKISGPKGFSALMVKSRIVRELTSGRILKKWRLLPSIDMKTLNTDQKYMFKNFHSPGGQFNSKVICCY